MMSLKCLFPFFVIVIFSHVSAEARDISFFTVDDFLRSRVDFWKSIYSKYQTGTGVLHDEVELSIVYKEISIVGISGKQRRNYIKNEKMKVRDILLSIRRKGFSNLTEEERSIHEKIKGVSDAEYDRLLRGIRWQEGLSDRFLAGIKRSYIYLDHIKKIFQEHDLPEELAFLPHVESSFNYQAYSKVGAAGIWQFMRSTARLYGLRMNYIIDERLDPLKCAIAAARLLKSNFSRLGSWPLAITAYNHGVNGMERAARLAQTTDMTEIIRNYKGSRFGFASRNFYVSFLAALEVSHEPEKYFGSITKPERIRFSVLKLPKNVSVEQMTRVLGISREEFHSYNRSIRSHALKSNLMIPSGFEIKVPLWEDDRIAEIKEQLLAVKETTPVIASGAIHVLRRGESLYQIAMDYRVSLAQLIELNNISNPRSMIPGLEVKIPPSPGQKVVVAEVKVPKISGDVDDYQDFASKVVPIEIPEVIQIENLWDYVGRSEPYVVANIDQNVATMGDLVQTYRFESEKMSENVHRIYIEVNETLGHYADWSGKGLSKIRALNGFRAGGAIRQGAKIDLPLSEEEMTKFNSIRLQYHASIEEDFYDNFKITGTVDYKIKPYDTINRIVEKHEVPLWLLRKFMQDNLDMKIYVGQIIQLPVVEAKNEI